MPGPDYPYDRDKNQPAETLGRQVTEATHDELNPAYAVVDPADGGGGEMQTFASTGEEPDPDGDDPDGDDPDGDDPDGQPDGGGDEGGLDQPDAPYTSGH